MTRRIFPGRRLDTALEADWEVPNERYLAIWVDATGLTAEQLLAAERRWTTELRQQGWRGAEHWFFLGMEGRS